MRVEHQQEKINWNQYHGQWKPGMPAAEYSFVEQIDGRGAFSFCMCPGGILVPSSTEAGTVVLNGMSNSARSGKFANAGVVVQIEPEDVPGDIPVGICGLRTRRAFSENGFRADYYFNAVECCLMEALTGKDCMIFCDECMADQVMERIDSMRAFGAKLEAER